MVFRSCFIVILIFVLFSESRILAQDLSALPSYQVIFDDFKYDATGYPGLPGDTNLFERNPWNDRFGGAQYVGFAWFYYNWRWRFRGGTIHPNGEIDLDHAWPYTVKLTASEGYTRDTSNRGSVPVQMESGFVYDSGTWAINVRLSDLEQIRYFTQAFWLISPVATTPENGGFRSWVEFNHEWQNWFSLNFSPSVDGAIETLSDDIWDHDNEWVVSRGYSGNVFSSESLPSPQSRAYLANGLRMFDLDSRSFETGETAGGIALKNPLKVDASDFSCYRSLKGILSNIDDPEICMNALQTDLSGYANPWVQLMIQYDGYEVVYSVFAPTPAKGFTHMASRVVLNRKALPMKVNLGIHTPNSSIVLGPEETSTMEIDWFYYSPNTTLTHADINEDIDLFRNLEWPRVNLDADTLSPPRSRPWRIQHLKTPDEADSNWLVTPTLRESNGVEVQWNYRIRSATDDFFSDWTGWHNGGFTMEVKPEPFEIEMDVRVKDHHASDARDRIFWANMPCLRYNYQLKTSSECAGGIQENAIFSSDQIPRRLVLEENYPDPAHTQTTVRFGLPDSSNVIIVLYDSLGREVKTVVDQHFGAGYHVISWSVTDLPAGTYFFKLQAGGDSLTKSLVIVK